MMNCSIHNYKEWIGAYIDGRLSRKDMLSAESFLQQHPNLLDSYLNELEEFSLASEDIELVGKEKLYMRIVATASIHENNFTEYFIGSIEGMLDKSKKAELDSFLSLNPKLQNEFDIYGSTKLVADLSSQYPDKKELEKKQRPAVPLFWPISAAASILLIVGLWFFWPSQTMNNNTAMAVNKIQINLVHRFVSPDPGLRRDDVVQNKFVQFNKPDIKNQDLKKIKEKIRPVEMAVVVNILQTANLKPQTSNALTLKDIPKVDINLLPLNDEDLVENVPKKKGLLNKILRDEPKYIEDYVNATFGMFKENKEDDKWVLKVDRDENGKSKSVKFSSPVFSVKSAN